MKKLTLVVLLLLITTYKAQVWLVDPLEALYPDSNDVEQYTNIWECDFPKGVIADVHILAKIPLGENFKFNVKLNDKEIDYSVIKRLIAVPVEENTGLDSRTEKYLNKINPHVIRRAPFNIFEVIQPVDVNEFVSSETYSAFRLEIPKHQITETGEYKVEINVSSKSLNKTAEFNFSVYPVEVPKISESEFFYTNWFSLSRMEKFHKLTRWTESWYNMLGNYAALMAHGRQNSITLPGELFKFTNNEFTIESEHLLRFIGIFRNNGFKYFESPHLMNRGKNDDWGDPELKVGLTGRRYYTENGKADIQKIMFKIRDFAVDNNLTNNWFQHISDEPTSVNAACYKDVAKQVKDIFPEILIMEATNDRDSLVGAIDIWCPLINDFQENEKFFREREEAGEKIFVYTCLIPGGPWLNRTLDMERIRQVHFGWGAAKYNTSGYLHWGLNWYSADPYKQSVVKHPSPSAGPNNFLPAGDTHVIYPGKEGPLSSVRFEAHRVGCEDYELLMMLKNKDEKQFYNLVEKQFRTYTDYNLNLKEYRKVRSALLQYL